MLLAFHKPYGVLCQFTPDGSPNRPLSEFGFPGGVYSIGRLDVDSEGLLLLSDEAALNERLLHPRHAHEREYWAQVERIPTSESFETLSRGVMIQGRATLPCRAWLLDPQPEGVCVTPPAPSERVGETYSAQRMTRPAIPPRDPPIRFRKSVPDCWIGLELIEGKNRQVRRMTAAIGHPTLRLIRVRIGRFELGTLAPGKWRLLDERERKLVLDTAT
ncbi:MAG: pseudouridine synthase [Verrucomicrobia bacterium]|nr:pseudouridine synthase [Verrucomicrobiota bacterium]